MKKTAIEIDTLGTKPGVEGVIWRLVKHWNPDGLEAWLKDEQLRGTDVDDLARALGEVMAGATMGYAVNTLDPQNAVVGPRGVVQAFQRSLQAKVNRHNTHMSPGGVFLPPEGGMVQ